MIEIDLLRDERMMNDERDGKLLGKVEVSLEVLKRFCGNWCRLG
jgi:hypothetical protein